MKESYSKRYYCTNCNEWSNIYYERDVVAEKYPQCPNCGVSQRDIIERDILTQGSL